MKNTPRHKARRLNRQSSALKELAWNIHFSMHYNNKKSDVNMLIETAKQLDREFDRLVRTQLRFKRNTR